jgi:anaerobic selenocysteine-containing dehydrogenase
MEISKTGNAITRRKFMDLSLKGSAGIGLTQALPISLLASSGCSPEGTKTVHGACYHDCPDTCSWTVTALDGKITDFRANAANPYTAGKLCNKMESFPSDITFHPERVLTPLKRVGKKGAADFIPISWDQAISEVAGKLQTIISEKGGEAVLPYNFAGTEGLIQGNYFSKRFFARIGASKLERTICGDAAVEGVMATNGQTTGVLPEDIVYSRYIILWGTNPVLSNQHLWHLVLQAKQDGAKVVVIDPFQSQSALAADWHVQPMPGTDTALALAMIHVILAENLQDQEYIDQYTLGIAELTAHVQQYSPPIVAKITGLEEEEIKRLAREYAKGTPSLIRVLVGLEHQANGSSAFRAIAMLPALIGAWRQRGGGLLHMTYELFGQAVNWERLSLYESIQKNETRSVNMVQIGRALTDEALHPAVHALLVYNANPAVIAPDQNLVRKGLEREDLLTVVLEHFITDTARYADYVFPATTQLEHWDLMDSWGQTYLNLNQPVIPPLGEAKSNSEFFRVLAKEMGFQEDYLYETDLAIIEKTLDSDHAFLKGITFKSLKKSGWAKLNLPEPWLPHVKGNFATSSGKCEFYNSSVDPPIAAYQLVQYSADEQAHYPLQLLTIKSTKNFLNSSHANVDHLQKKEGKPVLDIHRLDAEARGIKDGDEVKVHNQKGEVFITARIREKVRQGVVCLPQGFWPSKIKGGSSANALTNDRLTDVGGGAALQEARVEVSLLVSTISSNDNLGSYPLRDA